MKSLFLMLLFAWSVHEVSIKQIKVRPPGYWPIESPVTYQAVMPVLNRAVQHVEEEDHADSLNSEFDPTTELLQASLAGVVSMAPALLSTVY
jgi:hypothetical protein